MGIAIQDVTKYIQDTYQYNKETGEIFWKNKPKGKVTFKSKNKGGYLCGGVLGKQYYTHRVAWLLHYGSWPDGPVDHINGIKSDNRIENLRVVTPEENQKNQKKHSRNTTGVVGVYWVGRVNRWQVQIGLNGKDKHLGLFKDFDKAMIARKEAEVKYGYHKNHGRD
jgi:hypothetical protein